MLHSISRTKKIWRIVPVVVLVAAVLLAGPLSAEAGVCERALEACLIDAVFGAILSLSPGVLFAFTASCIMGYEWCLLYYV